MNVVITEQEAFVWKDDIVKVSYKLYLFRYISRNVFKSHFFWCKRCLLLNKRYNSCRVLAFSTIFFHSRRSWVVPTT